MSEWESVGFYVSWQYLGSRIDQEPVDLPDAVLDLLYYETCLRTHRVLGDNEGLFKTELGQER